MKATYKVWEVKDDNISGSSGVIVELNANVKGFPGKIVVAMDKSDRVCVGDLFTVTVERAP